jgi:hypothetical protein
LVRQKPKVHFTIVGRFGDSLIKKVFCLDINEFFLCHIASFLFYAAKKAQPCAKPMWKQKLFV